MNLEGIKNKLILTYNVINHVPPSTYLKKKCILEIISSLSWKGYTLLQGADEEVMVNLYDLPLLDCYHAFCFYCGQTVLHS